MTTRRDFLRRSACGLSAAAFVSSLERFGLLSAATAPASDYRALVCLFLFGGNDGNNTVVPYDDYAAYQAVRGTTAALNLSKSDLLPISVPSHAATFGLHPALADLAALYGQGDLAVVCNVGTLVQPIARGDFLAGAPRPDSLFSHFDQQSQWQSSIPNGTSPLAATGWGGRTADVITAANGAASIPMVVSVAGITLFSTGVTVRPLVPGASLAGFSDEARSGALRTLLGLDPEKPLVAAQSGIVAAGIDDIAALDAALAEVPPSRRLFPRPTSAGSSSRSPGSSRRARRSE